jgi:hypothetical protein
VTEPAMIIPMPTIARSQQRYDRWLRNLVQRAGDVTVARTWESLARRRPGGSSRRQRSSSVWM